MAEVRAWGRCGCLTPWCGSNWAALSGEVLGLAPGEIRVSREGFTDHPRDWRCEMASRSGCAGAGGELAPCGLCSTLHPSLPFKPPPGFSLL